MVNKWHQQAIILLIGITAFIVSLFKGNTPEGAVLSNFGIISSVVAIVLIFFERVLWRIPLLYPWFVSVPNLNGSWNAQANITFPGNPETTKNDAGTLVFEQSYNEIYMQITWSDNSIMEFFEATPLAISGHRTKHFALTAIYQYNPNDGKKITRSTFMSFSIPSKFLKNIPITFTIFYSTTDGQHGEITLTKNQG